MSNETIMLTSGYYPPILCSHDDNSHNLFLLLLFFNTMLFVGTVAFSAIF